ncbi:MAG: CreA family protein [Gallionella sp.]|nr:CreA family protein [Gallionella sp.]
MLRFSQTSSMVILTILCIPQVFAEEIGSVNTEWKLMGSHQLVVEAYDDPKVEGVSCYVAKPQRGGVSGAVGVAEELSDVSIACRQVGVIRFKESLPRQEDAFSERRSLIFKTLHVVRMVDTARNTLVYLSYTDKLINGSPQNSVTAVAVDRSVTIPVKK